MRDCKEVKHLRKEIGDEDAQKKLWVFSEKQIEALEKDSAVKRALAKKENEGSVRAETVVPSKDGKGVAVEEEKATIASRAPGSRRSRKTG